MKNKPNVFFFILFIDFFCYEGKHQGIQQNLTYPTEEKQNTEKKGKGKKQGKQNNRQRDDSKPWFIFSRQKYKLLNTEMYNKATKTNGFHDNFVKEGNSPQSIEREEKQNKKKNPQGK